MPETRTLANTKNLIIAAIIDGLYSFKTEKDGLDLLESLKDKFIISQKYIRFPNEIALWIKGYDLTPGFKGNFASLTVYKEGKLWKIKCKKLPIEAKFHPQKEIVKQKHPNWGHPALRGVKKKKLYESPEMANKELVLLQQEFPTVAIPATNRLYLMIYEKVEKKGRVEKYVLEIKPDESGKCYIDYKVNTPKPKVIRATPQEPQEDIGKFTAQVLKKEAARRNHKARHPAA